MKKLLSILSIVFIASIFFSSCTTLKTTMKEPNVRVELNKNDFNLSQQVSAEASSTKIIGIDWDRLFMKKTGTIESSSMTINLASLPVIGNMMCDKTANYALYNLMNDNEGYDVIFYPQYATKVEKPILGMGFIMKKTTVRTTAKLGKLK